MRPSLSFVVLSLSLLAFTILAIIGDIPYWVWYIPVGVAIMATLTIFRGIYVPQKAVDRGMELINSQDYNNRLVKVGEPNADKIVTLFNSLIDKLRAERLQNREQESLLKLLIEASPMGVVMLDFNGNISLANNSFLKMFEVKKFSDIEGKKIRAIKSDLIPEMLKVPLGNSEIIRKGDFRIYRIYHLNFIQEGFRREFFLLESLTEEIIKAEKTAYEKVIRTISHEVNNSMGGLRTVLEIVSDSTDDPELKRVVESCDRRCENMGNFIKDYAEVVKLPQPVLARLDLGREIESMLPFLRTLLTEKIKLIYYRPETEAIINADLALLQQVILNIVKNASESIVQEGFVKIEIHQSKDEVNLVISNNGLPIEAEISSQLFTPFFTTKPDGKGIGLTLIREVLNRHSAKYSLSTGEDGITRFSIIFKL